MAEGSQGARVLVVDDTRLHRELYQSALEGIARVESCASAEEALAALRREPADVVVSDLAVPGPSGLELLGRLRREQPGTDFVLVIAGASVESALQALRMGAVDYLRKPVAPEEVALVVERTLSRRRLLRENDRLRELLATGEACRALGPCLEPGEIYPVALDIVLTTLGHPRGIAVFRRSALFPSDGLAFRGFPESDSSRLRRILIGEKPVDLEAFRTLQVAKAGPVHDVLRRAEVSGGPLLLVPVEGRENEVGVLAILEDGRPFTEDDLERARIVAGHASVALHNAERYHRAKERAFVDDVTGLYNARYLFTALDHELHRAQRYGNELTVLFLDLDRFKLVNDRHGHLLGTRTLRRLAEVLAQCVRQVDTLARYGGDEFTILLADTGLASGLLIAERIRATVEAARFETQGNELLRLTVSTGVAAYPRHGRTPEALLDLSDKAMYRAKSMGRNRVCSASDLED